MCFGALCRETSAVNDVRIDAVNDALGGSYFRNKATIVDRLAAIYKAQSVTKPAAYVCDTMLWKPAHALSAPCCACRA